MKAFIESQFGYCPLAWMFCGRQQNNQINDLHERTLRIVYNDNKSTFENLLELDNSVSVKHNLSNQVMSELFNLRNINYDFCSQTDFEVGPINTYNCSWYTVFKIFCSKNLEHCANLH